MIKHDAPISDIACYQKKWVATAGYDNKVILWDAANKTSLAVGYHDHLANKCTFSKDGRYLASGSSDHTARIWSLPSMKLVCVCARHDDDVEEIMFHPSKDLLATSSRDHKIRVFNFHGELINVYVSHRADVLSIAWINDGKQLVSSSDDGTIKYWDAESAELMKNISLADVETDTIVIADNGTVFAGNDDGEIVTLRNTVTAKTACHKSGIKKIAHLPNSRTLASLSYDRSVKLWHIADDDTLSLQQQETLPSIIWPRACEFLDDDNLVFGSFGSSYAQLQLSTRDWHYQHIIDTNGFNAVTVSDNSVLTVGDAGIVKANGKSVIKVGSLCNFITKFANTVITGGQLGQVFNADTGEIIYQHHSPLNCAVSFKHKQKYYLAVGCYTGEVILLTTDNKNNIFCQDVIRIHQNAIKCLAVSETELFSVSADREAVWFSLADFTCIERCKAAHDRIINAAINIDDKTFASAGRDCVLTIWRDKTTSSYETTHTHSIKCLAVAPEKKLLALGSYSGDVSLMDYDSGKTVIQCRPTSAGISSICFDEQLQQFIASSYDGHLYHIGVSA